MFSKKNILNFFDCTWTMINIFFTEYFQEKKMIY
jgi:hypothetical protein